MAEDPAKTFGPLLGHCIDDSREERAGRVAVEGAAFLILGVLSSVLTTYAFSALGLFV